MEIVGQPFPFGLRRRGEMRGAGRQGAVGLRLGDVDRTAAGIAVDELQVRGFRLAASHGSILPTLHCGPIGLRSWSTTGGVGVPFGAAQATDSAQYSGDAGWGYPVGKFARLVSELPRRSRDRKSQTLTGPLPHAR